MSRVAVIGAGFSGLAVSYFLTAEGQTVTLYDEKGIGGGTSGIASGLLHPYPGEHARLSWKGQEGLAATKELLEIVSNKRGNSVYSGDGILRFAISKEQEETFRTQASESDDIEWWNIERCKKEVDSDIDFPAILIRSGVTVHSLSYLKGLWSLVQERGGEFIRKKVRLDKFRDYDQVVIAAGSGISEWDALCPYFNCNKGQILKCSTPEQLKLERSVIGKGYIAKSESIKECVVGSTYEHHFSDENPCREKAEEIIFSQVDRFLPSQFEWEVKGCFAGMRVASKKSYHPSLGKLDERTWLITGMGSRGLLYHAYLGKKLVLAMMENCEAALPKEVLLKR